MLYSGRVRDLMINEHSLRRVEEMKPVSERVVDAIASLEGVASTDLDPVRYDAIDPDALDSLFAGSRAMGTVEFSYHGYEVVVRGDGRVEVE